MSDRIEEIRSRFTAALQAAKAQRDRQSQGFIIPCMEHTEAIRKWEAHVPADLEFLLAEVERLTAELGAMKERWTPTPCPHRWTESGGFSSDSTCAQCGELV